MQGAWVQSLVMGTKILHATWCGLKKKTNKNVELKSLLMKVKVESEKVGLKLKTYLVSWIQNKDLVSVYQRALEVG